MGVTIRVTSEGIKLETVIHVYTDKKGRHVFENRKGEQVATTYSSVIAGSMIERYEREGIRVIEHTGPPPTHDSGS